MMNETPLVSIIVPIYNVENYLEQCVKSIVAQTYQNIEIILVDDGSLDTSGKLADKLSLTDNRIRVIHQKNGGLSAARNTGIDSCNGEWIAFVDSDDYIASNYVERMLSVALKDGTKLVNSHYFEVDENTQKIVSTPWYVESGVYDAHDFWLEYYNTHAQQVSMIVAWDKLYSNEIFKDIRYKVGIVNEDEQIIYSIVKQAGQISIIEDALYYYRVNRDDSIMTKIGKDSKLRKSRYDLLCNRTQLMILDGLFDIAELCNTESYAVLACDYGRSPSLENKEIFIEERKKFERNSDILAKQGYKMTPEVKNGYSHPLRLAYTKYGSLPLIKGRIKIILPGLFYFLKSHFEKTDSEKEEK